MISRIGTNTTKRLFSANPTPPGRFRRIISNLSDEAIFNASLGVMGAGAGALGYGLWHYAQVLPDNVVTNTN